MSRRASKQQAFSFSSLVTPAIIQGRRSFARDPGSTTFTANCRELSRAYHLSRGGPKLLPAARLFGAVERYTRILHQLRHARYKVVPYLIDLAGRSSAWLKEPEDFRPRTTHGRDQLPELVRYLFEAYRVPSWLRATQSPGRGRPARTPAFGWYIHVAQGQNLRTAAGLPLSLSRRAAHEAMAAPARYAPQQALLYGYLRAHDAAHAVRDALLQVARVRAFVLDETSLKLFEKIARARQLPADQVRPLFDYAQVRRREGGSLDVSVAVLLRGLRRWYAGIRDAVVREQALKFGPQFEERWGSSLPDQSFSGSGEQGDYALSELRSPREVFEEGQVMHHCVFIYVQAARAGAMSLWSLRLSRAGREVGRVTLRVITKDRAVVEARRRCNESIAPHERELLQTWASSRGLSWAPGL